jgi:3-oxoadipate enol-lactonase
VYAPAQTIQTRLGNLKVFVPDGGAQVALWPGVFHDHSLHLPLAKELSRAGVGTVLIEPPGFGGSDPITQLFTMAECGMAMVDVIAALGLGPMVVGGTSWGGATAAWAGIQAPEHVRAAVLMNAPYDKGHRKQIAGPIPAMARWIPASLFALGGVPAGVAPSRIRSRGWPLAVAQRVALRSATGRCRQIAGKQVFWHRESLFEPLENMSVPTLVVAGVEDQLCPVRHAERAAASIPRHELWLAEKTGHLTAFEAPEETAERILAFMATLG